MNPRRVHELMKANFPKVDLAKSTWVNLLERDGSVRGNVLATLIDEFIHAEDMLVEVNRKLGDLVSGQDIASYVERNVGRGEIRMADRSFHGYVLVGMNGVATGGHCIKLESAAAVEFPASAQPTDEQTTSIAMLKSSSGAL